MALRKRLFGKFFWFSGWAMLAWFPSMMLGMGMAWGRLGASPLLKLLFRVITSAAFFILKIDRAGPLEFVPCC